MEEKNSDSIFDIDGDGIQVKPQPSIYLLVQNWSFVSLEWSSRK